MQESDIHLRISHKLYISQLLITNCCALEFIQQIGFIFSFMSIRSYTQYRIVVLTMLEHCCTYLKKSEPFPHFIPVSGNQNCSPKVLDDSGRPIFLGPSQGLSDRLEIEGVDQGCAFGQTGLKITNIDKVNIM